MVVEEDREVKEAREVKGSKREGTIVPMLSHLETKVLEYLASRPGVIITNHEIAQAVWGYNVGNALIRVHIYRIRDKINNKRLIQTVQGRGYVFNSHVCEACNGAGFVFNESAVVKEIMLYGTEG